MARKAARVREIAGLKALSFAQSDRHGSHVGPALWPYRDRLPVTDAHSPSRSRSRKRLLISDALVDGLDGDRPRRAASDSIRLMGSETGRHSPASRRRTRHPGPKGITPRRKLTIDLRHHSQALQGSKSHTSRKTAFQGADQPYVIFTRTIRAPMA
jgi:hypothetical protein